MDEETEVMLLASKVLPYIWQKYAFGPLTFTRNNILFDTLKELVEDLGKVVWARMFVTMDEWGPFLDNHYERYTESFHLFANYCVFGCHIEKRHVLNPFELMVNVFALAAYFVAYAININRNHKKLIKIVPNILHMFHKRVLSASITSIGDWTNFQRYLRNSYYLKKHEAIEKHLAANGKFSSVNQKVLQMDIIQRASKITGERVESDLPSLDISMLFMGYEPLLIVTLAGSRPEDSRNLSSTKSYVTGDIEVGSKYEASGPVYLSPPRSTDKGPSDEFVNRYFGKRFKFVGDNEVYVGETAKAAVLSKAEEFLTDAYDEIDFSNYLLDISFKHLEDKIAELRAARPV